MAFSKEYIEPHRNTLFNKSNVHKLNLSALLSWRQALKEMVFKSNNVSKPTITSHGWWSS